jgi:hypothetical protein
MTDLIVLGFPSRDLAEEARCRSAELDKQGALDLDGAAVATRGGLCEPRPATPSGSLLSSRLRGPVAGVAILRGRRGGR